MTQFSAERWAEVIKVEVGETLEVMLRENPSTGFRWLILDQLLKKNNMQEIVHESNASFKRDENRRGAVGVGGVRTLRLEFLKEGSGEIELFHARPWEVE